MCIPFVSKSRNTAKPPTASRRNSLKFGDLHGDLGEVCKKSKTSTDTVEIKHTKREKIKFAISREFLGWRYWRYWWIECGRQTLRLIPKGHTFPSVPSRPGPIRAVLRLASKSGVHQHFPWRLFKVAASHCGVHISEWVTVQQQLPLESK